MMQIHNLNKLPLYREKLFLTPFKWELVIKLRPISIKRLSQMQKALTIYTRSHSLQPILGMNSCLTTFWHWVIPLQKRCLTLKLKLYLRGEDWRIQHLHNDAHSGTSCLCLVDGQHELTHTPAVSDGDIWHEFNSSSNNSIAVSRCNVANSWK